MIDREYWDFNPGWLEYIKTHWTGIGRVQLTYEDHPERLEFMRRAEQAFKSRGIPVRVIKTYLSIQKPCGGDGYESGYPHTHEPKNATTLVHYLQPGDIPAPLDIFDGEKVIETIYPEIGLTVFIPNDVLHGVRKNNGNEDRIQFIATALR